MGAQGQGSLTMAPPLSLAVLPTSSSSMENATTSSVAPPPAPLEPEPEPGTSIVILLVYRTLGGLLPAQFQAERRGARYTGGVTPSPAPGASRKLLASLANEQVHGHTDCHAGSSAQRHAGPLPRHVCSVGWRRVTDRHRAMMGCQRKERCRSQVQTGKLADRGKQRRASRWRSDGVAGRAFRGA